MNGEGFAYFRWTYLIRDKHAATASRYYWELTRLDAELRRFAL